jgi:hypothetical protein
VRVTMEGTKVGSPASDIAMPGFAGPLSDTEIAAISNYIIGHFGRKTGNGTAVGVKPLCALTWKAAVPGVDRGTCRAWSRARQGSVWPSSSRRRLRQISVCRTWHWPPPPAGFAQA